ncbi:unnamed protein product, partial [Medioppia subpectinata]
MAARKLFPFFDCAYQGFASGDVDTDAVGVRTNPPVHGSRIVTKVLNDPQLRQEWRESIKLMRDRIDGMRRALSAHIERLGTPGQWSHITEQSG